MIFQAVAGLRKSTIGQGEEGVERRRFSLTRARANGYTSPSATQSRRRLTWYQETLGNSVRNHKYLLAAAVLLTTACSDPFASQDWDGTAVQATLYSASRDSYVGRPSAFDLASSPPRVVAIESEAGAGSWDVILVDSANGLALESAATFEGITSRARIAVINNTSFDNVGSAPGDTTKYSIGPVPLTLGSVYVIRSRTASCALQAGPIYAKLQPTAIDVTTGTFTFNYVANPNCNDRSLTAPKS
jgi:hypothetical protein